MVGGIGVFSVELQSSLTSSFLAPPLFLLLEWECLFPAIVYCFFFPMCKLSQLKDYLDSQRRIWIKIIFRTAKRLGTLKDGLNASFIMRQP